MKPKFCQQTRHRLFIQIGSAATALFSFAAMAHTGSSTEAHTHGMHSFFAGLLHPITGLDHLAAMLAVGLWGALTHQWKGTLRAPLAFILLLLVGAVAGMAGMSVPWVEPLIAATILVLGLLVLSRSALGNYAAPLLAGGFALFHGLAHGVELSAMPQPLLALLGMLIATSALHLTGLMLGWQLRSRPLWMGRMVGVAMTLLGAQWVWAAI